jgi:hypothetical protein
LVKIRRLVDDATDLAVRAASGVASLGQRGLHGASHHTNALGFGFGRPPPQAKLSPERKHRMREQATQKLMEAYQLDEIACSVATMQSASSLEEVASLVLQRNPQDPDAKYVHFFHEKIPSRQLAECTSLDPLNEIAAAKPSCSEPLRTRAMVRIFKGDYQGAVDDLTEALKLHRLYRPAHASPRGSQETQLLERQQHGVSRRQEDVILKEEDQPSSLEMQLLFQRAGVYLAIACRHVTTALPADSVAVNGGAQTEVVEGDSWPELSPVEKEAQRTVAEAKKLVRHNAKRALRDYTAYLSHFEYSPDLPIEIAEDFTGKVNSAVNGVRAPRSHSYPSGPRSPLTSESEGAIAPHRIYALSDLFTSSPPSGLPPYPSTELVSAARMPPPSPGSAHTTTETLTCHPLLTDALHALLLCHSLIQTSAKELLRHAYMVARLARLADGYPVFQTSRCPARADWIEVLRAGGNWIQLGGSWEDLCAPAPLPLFQTTGNGATPVPMALPPSKQTKTHPAPGSDSPTATPESPTTALSEPDNRRKDRIHQQAVLDALSDDRVTDESSFRLAIRARQLRAEHDYRLDNAVAALNTKLARASLEEGPATADDDNPSSITSPTDTASPAAPNPSPAHANGSGGGVDVNTAKSAAPPQPTPAQPPPPPRAPAPAPNPAQSMPLSISPKPTPSSPPVDPEARPGGDYPISSERASAIARWVREAPPLSSAAGGGAGEGLRKRRKKPVRRATGGGGVAAAVAAEVGLVVWAAGDMEGGGGGV